MSELSVSCTARTFHAVSCRSHVRRTRRLRSDLATVASWRPSRRRRERTMNRSQRRPHVALAARSGYPALVLAIAAAFLLAGFVVAQDGADFQDLELELVAEGFTSPVALTAPPEDDRRFVVDQVGQIHVLNEDGSR